MGEGGAGKGGNYYWHDGDQHGYGYGKSNGKGYGQGYGGAKGQRDFNRPRPYGGGGDPYGDVIQAFHNGINQAQNLAEFVRLGGVMSGALTQDAHAQQSQQQPSKPRDDGDRLSQLEKLVAQMSGTKSGSLASESLTPMVTESDTSNNSHSIDEMVAKSSTVKTLWGELDAVKKDMVKVQKEVSDTNKAVVGLETSQQKNFDTLKEMLTGLRDRGAGVVGSESCNAAQASIGKAVHPEHSATPKTRTLPADLPSVVDEQMHNNFVEALGLNASSPKLGAAFTVDEGETTVPFEKWWDKAYQLKRSSTWQNIFRAWEIEETIVTSACDKDGIRDVLFNYLEADVKKPAD